MTTSIDTIRLLLHEVPHGQDLTDAQRTGTQCVWCEAAYEPRFVDLGGISARFRPQGCADCHPLHLAVVQTYFEWADHVAGCVLCADKRPCPSSGRMRDGHARARQDAGAQVTPRCFDCAGPVELQHPALPVLWLGEAAAPHLLYSHAGLCPVTEVTPHA